MSTTFDTLSDIIIDEILRILEFKDQVKLQYCNRRINRLLKHLVFEEVSVPEDNNDIKNMASQIGKYVKRIRSSVNKEFFDVVDQFTNLEHIRVFSNKKSDVFDQLYSLDIKLKSFHVTLFEPFPTQIQFNFNHVIKNLVKLHIIISNNKSQRLDVLEMLQIPNLKTLWLLANTYPVDTLVIINQNFPELKILKLISQGYIPELTLISTSFLKLKKLTLFLAGIRNCHQFPFQSFPQIKALEFGDRINIGESTINIIKEKFSKQLLALSIELFKFTKNDVSNFQNLRYTNLELKYNFDATSMQNLLLLPKLSELTLRNFLPETLFQNVECKSPLYSLTLLDPLFIPINFFKFLQFKVPSLTKLIINSDFDTSRFKASLFSKFNGQTNLNLLLLEIYRYEDGFVNWIKAQCPNVCLTYIDDDDDD